MKEKIEDIFSKPLPNKTFNSIQQNLGLVALSSWMKRKYKFSESIDSLVQVGLVVLQKTLVHILGNKNMRVTDLIERRALSKVRKEPKMVYLSSGLSLCWQHFVVFHQWQREIVKYCVVTGVKVDQWELNAIVLDPKRLMVIVICNYFFHFYVNSFEFKKDSGALCW